MRAGTFRGFEVTLHDPGVAVIQFNRPERLNGTTAHVKRDLVETLLQAQMDDAVRVVIFTGQGRAFSAGDDISGRTPDFAGAPALVPDIPPGHTDPIGTYEGLRAISQPLNAAVRKPRQAHDRRGQRGGHPDRASRWRWRATFASRPRRPGSAAPRCASASCPTRAGSTCSCRSSASRRRWTS